MQYSNFPHINHANFFIRSLVRSDLNDWYGYLSQAIVYEHTSWNLSSMNDLIPLLDEYESESPNSAIRFAIADQESEKLVGTIGLHTISSRNKTAELAYDLAPEVWGCGLATMCAQATIAWAMHTLKLNRVQATVLPANITSIRVIERCGMQLEGRLRNFRMVRGEPKDFLIYALTS